MTVTILRETLLDRQEIKQVQLLPVAGTGNTLPNHICWSERAQALLDDLRARSEALHTPLAIEGDIGFITCWGGTVYTMEIRHGNAFRGDSRSRSSS